MERIIEIYQPNFEGIIYSYGNGPGWGSGNGFGCVSGAGDGSGWGDGDGWGAGYPDGEMEMELEM